ncbi:MAG: superoxide dismutase [Gloeomargaritaceae cyanobacterium C42_A2020_066]|nr:superoxide dismutase [Gloeomargaritaceae cyanobacterium C42_A2020_066]
MNWTRRDCLRGFGLGVGLYVLGSGRPADAQAQTADGPFTLPPLPYAYDALEPWIDARTMTIHHDKHHAAYVANLNRAISAYPELTRLSLEDLLRRLDRLPTEIQRTVRNNGGGHANHSLFWEIMSPQGGDEPKGVLAEAIDRQFGSFPAFQDQFEAAGLGVFGSGWVWLVSTPQKTLEIVTTANQDSPISQGKTPLLGNDLWEHAYYLNYQNRRADYLKAWWQVVNWPAVSQRWDATA